VDDEMEEERAKMRAQRREEVESMIKSGIGKIFGWGADVSLHSKGGKYAADKAPISGVGSGKKHRMLETGLGLDMAGGGTLRSLHLGTVVGLSDLSYSDAGNTATMKSLQLTATADANAQTDWEEDGLKMEEAAVHGSGKVLVEFEGLHYEQDKNWAAGAPEGVDTKQDHYKKHGNTSNADAPLSDGSSGVYYNAGDYANRVNKGEGVVGEQYSEELSMVEGIKKTVIGSGTDAIVGATPGGADVQQDYESQTGETVGTTFANYYEDKTISAKNAEVYGNYQELYDSNQAKKKK
ncbi:MAG: hypothetical protein ACI9MR_004627, partial [Myxococcota bacterium]